MKTLKKILIGILYVPVLILFAADTKASAQVGLSAIVAAVTTLILLKILRG